MRDAPPDPLPDLTPTIPVFIVGCRRSGTTLLSRLVDAHSAFAVYHESFLYPLFRDELRWYGDLRRSANLDSLIADVREAIATQIGEVPSPQRIREATPAPSLSGILAGLLRLYALQQGKRRGGDKTPEHHRYLGDILRDFPASPVLFLMRDPRDTVHSTRRVFQSSVAGAAEAWRQAFESYRVHADRIHLVRYETLVQDPSGEVRRVCTRLGEPFEESMLDFHRHSEGFRRLGGEKLSAAIDAGSVGVYRAMAQHEVRRIEEICGEGMESLGYSFSQLPGTGRSAAPQRPVAGRTRWVLDRLRYYGLNRDRWRRGAARWKIMLRARLRFVVRRALPSRG